ncbi:hypothetical protein IHE35_09920 [Acinetobacter sp. ASP199]|nr:hypothetical protein IHE35_09920 [Acinetobacter sp. ASP199]
MAQDFKDGRNFIYRAEPERELAIKTDHFILNSLALSWVIVMVAFKENGLRVAVNE